MKNMREGRLEEPLDRAMPGPGALSTRFSRIVGLFSLFFLQLVKGLEGTQSSSTAVNESAKHGSSSSSLGLKVLIVCLGLVALVAFSVLLFKIWQKKKREEQQARLLKLFEDDDELEIELGIRD